MAQGWESPDGSRSIVFAPGVVSAVRALAIGGFHALPKRGAEIGGLLLGRVLRTNPLLARITGFEEIPCTHAFGPSYILSDEDKLVLDAALRRERSEPVIGFVRSYTNREMVLDETDRNLFEHYFPTERAIFLLLQPRITGVCTATFLFPENGELGWEPQYAAFDFSEARLAGEGAAAAAPPPAPQTEAPAPPPESEPAPVPSFARQEPFIEPEPRTKRGMLLPLLGWIALCLAAAGIYELWTMARAPRWAPLGLTAQMSPGAIHLAWNPNSHPAHDAARGVLDIDDAGSHQRVSLTAAQVHAAAYEYRPASADVLFRLELYGGSFAAAGDSLRVVSPPPAAAAASKAPSNPAPLPEREADRTLAGSSPTNAAWLPEPLREIHPDIPSGIRARISERVVVPVEVKVAVSGKVTSASIRGAHAVSGDGVYQYLAASARQAAMQWRFSPARNKSGKPIPAARTVYFVFTNSGGG